MKQKVTLTFIFRRKITDESYDAEPSVGVDRYSCLESEKENPGRSRHELEMALHKRSFSRPSSRLVLSSIDLNAKSSTKNIDKSFLSPVTEKLPLFYAGSGEKPRMVLGKLGEESSSTTCCSSKVGGNFNVFYF